MRNTIRALALTPALLPGLAGAQTFPTVPDHTVIGRIGSGTGSGPSQAIPFSILTSQFGLVGIAGNLACFSSTTGRLQDCGVAPSNFLNGTKSGSTTVFATTSGPLTPGDCAKFDANGNLADNGTQCGANSNTPFTQDFIAGTGFTAGTTTSLTLSSAPSLSALLTITFDGIGQNANTWSLSGAVVTFNAAIPLNTQVVEAKWSTSSTLAGVGSITAGGAPVSGAVSFVAGPTTSVTTSGQNITIGNDISMVSIMDSAYGAQCNAILVSAAATYSITSGSNVLTGSGGSVNFASGDVGKSIWVPGAGVSGAGLSTTISSFVNATTVHLASNASTTISSLAVTQANPLVYGTDDTAAIQAAINATPNFGTLVINPITLSFPVVGCLIKQAGASGNALLVNHPINILGGGNLSALITDPSMGTSVVGIHAPESGQSWTGITWSGFTLGTNTNFVPFSRYGSFGIWFDATSGGSGGFLGVNVFNLRIGESSGDYSLMMDGIGSQGNRFINNTIWGGLELNGVIDSNVIAYNRFQGASIFGVNVIMTGGNFQYVGNSMTAAGGFCLAAGTAGALVPVIRDNYFEENSLTPPSFQHNAFVDIGCGSTNAITGAAIENNIIANIVSASTIAVFVESGSVSTSILHNFIANNTGRTGVNISGNSTLCGPNHFQTSATLSNGSGTLAQACSNY